MCKNCNYIHAVSPDYLKGLPPVFRKAMEDLHAGRITPEQLSPELVKAIAKELLAGIGEGFDMDADAHEETSTHTKLITEIESNVYVFSGFKTYHQLKEATMLLTDEHGLRKPFNKFLKDVQAINDTYNINYLHAEYNHAVACGQMTTNWEQILERAEVAPYLKYKTAEDERVRDSHRPLNNVIKRFDDAFWNVYYPPNGWNCRCDVVQIIDGEITEEFDAPELPAMFRNNVGKNGVVFPDTHPYFTMADNSAKPIIKANAEIIKENADKDKPKN